jgi:hypothetical protein
MAIIVKTENPEGLLYEIKRLIDEKVVGLWSYDTSGDFSHTPDKWINRAWLRPEVGDEELKFGILGTKDAPMTASLYSAYHGYFIEMLLTHLDKYFITAAATAKKSAPDYF